MASAPAPNPRLGREAVVRAVGALLRWLKHHPSPAPEPVYLLVTLKTAPVRRAPGKRPRKWRNVRALHLKAPESIALPLYAAPGTGGNDDSKDAKRQAATAVEQGRGKRGRKE
uniref:Uncharacterized protein n=1 Tax=Aegilops tauschii TaxID=37682 RepID=M8D4N0_AEGTA